MHFILFFIIFHFVPKTNSNLTLTLHQHHRRSIELGCTTTNFEHAVTWMGTSKNQKSEGYASDVRYWGENTILMKNTWVTMDNLRDNFGPIIDSRWEDFPTTFTKEFKNSHGNLEFQLLRKINVYNQFEIPISILAQQEAHLYICEYENGEPPNNKCFWFMFGAFKGKNSAIRKCAYGEINSKNESPKGNCKKFIAENATNPLFGDKWSHFVINFENISKSIIVKILGEDGVLRNFMETSENVYDNTTFQSIYVNTRTSDANGYWKLHQYNIIKKFQSLSPSKYKMFDVYMKNLCISLFVHVCAICKITFTTDNSLIGEIGPTYNERKLWKYRELKYEGTNESYINVYITTEGSDVALSNITTHNCNEKRRRIRRITIAQREIGNVSCEYLSKYEDAVTIKKPTAYNDFFCNSVSNYGSECFNCTDLEGGCRQTLICQKEGCYCSAGSHGDFCTEDCNLTYGFDCIETCGKCSNNCDPVNGVCDHNGCQNNFKNAKCDEADLPVLEEAPKLLDDKCHTECKFSINLTNYVGTQAPHYYQYETKTSMTGWMKGQLVKENEFVVDHLKILQDYEIRIVAYNYRNEAYNEDIPLSNFSTSCLEFSQDEFIITTTDTTANILISANSLSDAKCNKYNYEINISARQYGQYHDQFEIKYLEPYADYVATFINQRTKYSLEKTFKTSEGAPGCIENFKIDSVSDTEASFSWTEPRKPNGVILGYTITYLHRQYKSCNFGTNEAKTMNFDNTKAFINNLIPYSYYSVNIKAFTVKDGMEFGTSFETNLTDTIDQNSIKANLIVKSKTFNINFITSCELIKGPIYFHLILNCLNDWCDYPRRYIPFELIDIKIIYNLHPYTKYNLKLLMSRDNVSETAVEFENIQKNLLTDPDTPNPVKFFDFYEKYDKSVSLRWEAPYPPTGEIDYFQITYSYQFYYSRSNWINVDGVKCDIWKNMYCHTLSGLYKDYDYTIKIKVKNKKVNTFSKETQITTRIMLELPFPPKFLQSDWDEQYNLTLHWQHPNKTNGLTRFNLVYKNKIIKQFQIEKYNLTYNEKITFRGCKDERAELFLISVGQIGASSGERFLINCPPETPKYQKEPEIVERSNTSIKIKFSGPQKLNFDTKVYCVICGDLGKSESNFEIQQFLKDTFKIQSDGACYLAKVFAPNETSIVIGDGTMHELNKSIITNHVLEPSALIEIKIFIANSNSFFTRYTKYELSNTTSEGSIILTYQNEKHLYWLLLLILILPLGYIVWKKRMHVNLKHQFINRDNLPEVLPLTKTRSPTPVVNVMQSNVVPKGFSKLLKISEFEEYVKESIYNGELERQHSLFPKGEQKSCSYGKLPQNKSKNRYMNLVAYDHSRVHLTKLEDDQFSDYINANYIKGINTPRAYIATQGPKVATVRDFWRMIWDENVYHIVMLANVFENGKKKTEQYWPNYNDILTYNNINIKLQSSQVFADYEYRIFDVSNENETRKVEQLHFTSWPDHGVPLYAQSLVPFLRKILTIPQVDSPIVVHCSAGVGRTGTIILIDLCLRMAALTGTVDVLHHQHQLREQRSNMVDNIDQYKLAHLVILECLISPDTTIPCNNNFDKLLTKILENDITKQMNYIKNSAWQEETIATKSPTQKFDFPEKNRFPNIVPDSYGVVYLQPYPPQDGTSTYINAVYVDGFQVPKRYFTTQQPLSKTVKDFWRLAVQFDVSVVVSLHDIDLNDPTCCEYYPKSDVAMIITPELSLNHISTECLESYDLICISLTYKDEAKKITILQMNNWMYNDITPKSPKGLLAVWQQMSQLIWNENPIIITCRDGALGCGLYAAMCFILEKIKLEQICDVCQAVRVIRRSRKQFVQSEEQFVYLYNISKLYLQEFELYSNFAQK